MAKKEQAKKQEETKNIPAVVEPKKNEIVESSFFEGMAGEGFENVSQRNLLIPRITILQDLSPQVKPKKAEYIEGAKIGDICDVGTMDLFEEPLEFLPVYFTTQWLEWAPRDSGKGLVAIHNDPSILDKCEKDEKGRFLHDKNLVAETAQFFGLNLSAGGRRSFIPMSSTQLKKSKRWLTLATSEKVRRQDNTTFTPPIYYRVYLLSTVEEGNSQGDWVGWKVERGPRLEELDGWRDILKDATDFRKQLVAGDVRGDLAASEELRAQADQSDEKAM